MILLSYLLNGSLKLAYQVRGAYGQIWPLCNASQSFQAQIIPCLVALEL